MFNHLLTQRRLNTLLACVFLLGLGTLAILALGVLLAASLLLKTLFDCLTSLFQSLGAMLSAGGPFAQLLLFVFLLFLGWRAMPHLVRFVRQEIGRFQAEMAPTSEEEEYLEEEETLAAGPFFFSAEENGTAPVGRKTRVSRQPEAIIFQGPTSRRQVIVLPASSR
jgi:Sec-independent protein translocase protein TatA